MHRKNRKKIHSVTLREQIKQAPLLFALYVILRISVILVMIAQIMNRDWHNVMLCVLTLVLFTVPSFIEKNWHIDIPSTLEVIILLFIYSAEISGEIRSYYINIPGWDTVLHTITGFLSAAIGFSLVDIINRNERTKLYLSPLYVAIGAFCFSMTIGVLWEFFEFSMDWFFGLDMQKDTIINTINTVVLDPTRSNKVVTITGITSTAVNGVDLGINGYLDIGLIDTMKDLFVTLIGALVFSFIGFFYVKNRGEGKFAKRFIPTMKHVEKEEGKEE
ncbi:MAG: hypothetical protein IAA72_01515 [Spirochaetes bacterium]|uniref:Uncharacterized protein n=1 Tax=Candidatus Ornithospirochaeta stercoravium TaxID=2840897 RepID=A0A9D9I9G2_9SPIO|nr:hypothetical protein [Candidatus Ornithospirochaeta stercoravium]